MCALAEFPVTAYKLYRKPHVLREMLKFSKKTKLRFLIKKVW